MSTRGSDGKFQQGNPGGGRTKGSADARRVEGEALARELLANQSPELVKRFLGSTDDTVALTCFRFLWEQAFGKARIRADVDVNGGGDVNVILSVVRRSIVGGAAAPDVAGSAQHARSPGEDAVDRDGDQDR